MKVVVLVPVDSMGCSYREQNWDFVRSWWTLHFDYPLYVGASDRTPFSPAQARNNAAHKAGDWDVAIFADADTLVAPEAVREAVRIAADTDEMVLASTAHTYMDRFSTERYLETGMMFPVPTDWPDTVPERFKFDPRSIYRAPCSGVLAVSRTLWEQTGGYVDSLGGQDSHEDLIFWQQAVIFGAGVARVPGMQIHLWHPTADRIEGDNHRHYHRLVAMTDQPDARERAAEYLADLGHRVGVCTSSS